MRPPAPDLAGRRCLVTGAASGIGRATALAAARRGADLYLTDLAAAGLEAAVAEIRAAGGKVSRRLHLGVDRPPPPQRLAEDDRRQPARADQRARGLRAADDLRRPRRPRR